MINLEDRPKLICTKLAKSIYGFLYWLCIQNQNFLPSFDETALLTKMQTWNPNIWLDDMYNAIDELVTIGAINGYERMSRQNNEGRIRILFYITHPENIPECSKIINNTESIGTDRF